MKRVLIFGDLHVPTRADSIPDVLWDHITSQEYDFALVTGDLITEEDMRRVMPPLPKCYIVRGNMDRETKHPIHHIVKVGPLRVFLMHGTNLSPRGDLDQFWDILIEHKADIGVHGHTHEPQIELHNNRLFLNPGSITGATGGWGGRQDATFLELEVDNEKIIARLVSTDWKKLELIPLGYKKTELGIVHATYY